MTIAILCTDPSHPVTPHLRAWVEKMNASGRRAQLFHDKRELEGGDMLFLVSCTQIVGSDVRAKFRATLVLHASDLPRGRGWSPHIWTVLNGTDTITVSLIEAAEPVDSGAIWLQAVCPLEGHELLPEIEAKLFAAELSLMDEAAEKLGTIRPRLQEGDPGPYLRRRTPADSRLEPTKTIAEQFDLLRVVDGKRFPAFFEYRGYRYVVRIEKVQP